MAVRPVHSPLLCDPDWSTCRTDSKTKPNELRIYTRFVHHIIQSFELNLKKTHIVTSIGATIKLYNDVELPEWVSNNQVNNVIEQLQAVESELGMMVHGTHEKIKRAGSADFPLGQICFRLLSDALKNSILNLARPNILKSWSENILQYTPRLKEAMFKVALGSTNPFPTNSLLQVLAVLEELKNFVVTYKLLPVDELSLACLTKADQKVKLMMGRQPSAIRGNLGKNVYLEMQKLTVQQLLGIALFGIVVSWENCDSSKFEVFDWTKSFRSAIINAAVD